MQIDNDKKTGIVGTIVVHVVLLIILFLVFIHRPELQEEGGVPVMLGNVDMASGNADPYMMTDVDILNPGMPAAEAAPVESGYEEPVVPDVEDLIVQEEEPAVEMPAVKEKPVQPKPKETPKKKEKSKPIEQPKPVTQPKPEKTEAEKKAEAEKAAAEARAAQEKAAAAQAAQKISGAFGKGSKMGSTGVGESGEGYQGSPTGNSNTGKTSGVGGLGSFDLGGRGLAKGHEQLPLPNINAQEECRVVVTIWVNPAGQVYQTTINKRTNTQNAAIQNAALNAAKKAVFAPINGVENQTGTITYYFKLK